MASGTSIKFVFDTASGTTTHNINYANPDATSTNIAAAAQSFITNGTMFAKAPVSLKSATIITTTETDVTPQA